jgi:hypothetical protein
MEDYERGLREMGFESVQIVDTGKDLNAYAQLETQSGCCSPAMTSANTLHVVESCCASAANGSEAAAIHHGLAELLRKYNVNEFAASVQVYALKAR